MPINETPMTASPAPRVNYRGNADSIDYVPTADTPAGTIVPFGAGIGVTKLDIAAEQLGTLHLTGQWDAPKASGTAFAYGDALKWDAAATAADGAIGAMIAASATDAQAYCSAPDGAAATAAIVRAVLA